MSDTFHHYTDSFAQATHRQNTTFQSNAMFDALQIMRQINANIRSNDDRTILYDVRRLQAIGNTSGPDVLKRILTFIAFLKSSDILLDKFPDLESIAVPKAIEEGALSDFASFVSDKASTFKNAALSGVSDLHQGKLDVDLTAKMVMSMWQRYAGQNDLEATPPAVAQFIRTAFGKDISNQFNAALAPTLATESILYELADPVNSSWISRIDPNNLTKHIGADTQFPLPKPSNAKSQQVGDNHVLVSFSFVLGDRNSGLFAGIFDTEHGQEIMTMVKEINDDNEANADNYLHFLQMVALDFDPNGQTQVAIKKQQTDNPDNQQLSQAVTYLNSKTVGFAKDFAEVSTVISKIMRIQQKTTIMSRETLSALFRSIAKVLVAHNMVILPSKNKGKKGKPTNPYDEFEDDEEDGGEDERFIQSQPSKVFLRSLVDVSDLKTNPRFIDLTKENKDLMMNVIARVNAISDRPTLQQYLNVFKSKSYFGNFLLVELLVNDCMNKNNVPFSHVIDLDYLTKLTKLSKKSEPLIEKMLETIGKLSSKTLSNILIAIVRNNSVDKVSSNFAEKIFMCIE